MILFVRIFLFPFVFVDYFVSLDLEIFSVFLFLVSFLFPFAYFSVSSAPFPCFELKVAELLAQLYVRTSKRRESYNLFTECDKITQLLSTIDIRGR